MSQFTGTLNVNKIQSALFNMIISQDVIGGSIKANYNLVDKARVDAINSSRKGSSAKMFKVLERKVDLLLKI